MLIVYIVTDQSVFIFYIHLLTNTSFYDWQTQILRIFDDEYQCQSGDPNIIGEMCNDGTRSNPTGRGACSHHGGWIIGFVDNKIVI